jgi:hypothetical protein
MSSGKLLVEAHSDGVRGEVWRVGAFGGILRRAKELFRLFFISLYLEELVEYDQVIFEALSRLWWL